ncbi:unnamed protein product [Lampetra planeri]
MDVFLPASEDDELTSLKVVRCLQAHGNLRRRVGVVACTGQPGEIEAKQGEELPAVCAALAESQRTGTSTGWRQEQRRRGTAPASSWRKPISCFNCGLPGHIAAGCRTEPGQLVAPLSSSTPPTSAPLSLKASHGAPNTRSSLSPQASSSQIGSSSCAVQALVREAAWVPPVAQMLIPLRLRKQLDQVATACGILLSPSNRAVEGHSLVGAQTLVRGDQVPFLQVLNAGTRTAVV